MTNKLRKISLLLTVISSLILASCASKEVKVQSAETEYNEAMKILDDKDYNEAAEKFEKLYDNYPLSPWSIKAQAIAAYAYYADEKYDETIRVAQSFIELNPTSEYTPYMQYMKANSYYKLIPNVNRSQNYSKLASYDFRELVARFPNSAYTEDAKKKMEIIDEYLAGADMSVGRYQLENQNYIGAAIHFNNVVYRYAHTKQAPEAYFRLYEIYYKLGVNEKAEKIKQILVKNYPDRSWSKETTKS